ncbi:hypothetical protein PG993_006568 [Apiospora rasikravindrae]|uniref:Heterokaryon incompatibility domain-containing protein n=1 Tax=Apiospora rasikravindrae TaxID=990691 RepID=A0ABR1T623_9PEZI
MTEDVIDRIPKWTCLFDLFLAKPHSFYWMSWNLSFIDEKKAPDYAILSHTWEGDEVLFEGIKDGALSGWAHKQGAQKMWKSAEQALSDGLYWIWIHTLCIDKSSSAELFEAINSVFKWYGSSGLCYAYLSDVSGQLGRKDTNL